MRGSVVRTLRVAVFVCLASAGVASAQQFTYNPAGAGANDFSNMNKWMPVGVPGATDEAIINTGQINVPGNTTVDILTINNAAISINSAATLFVNTINLTDGNLNGVGTVHALNGGNFYSNASGAPNQINALLTNGGTIQVETGGLRLLNTGNSSGTITATMANTFFSVERNLTVTGPLNGRIVYPEFGTITNVNAPVTLTGTLELSSFNGKIFNGTGSLTVIGALNSLSGSGTNMNIPVTIDSSSTVSIQNVFGAGGLAFSMGVVNNGTFIINSDGNGNCPCGGNFNNNGTISLTGGHISMAASTVLTNNGSITLNNAYIDGNGTLTNPAGRTITSNATAGQNSTLRCMATNNAGTITVASGQFGISGGSVSGTIDASAAGADCAFLAAITTINPGAVLNGNFSITTLNSSAGGNAQFVAPTTVNGSIVFRSSGGFFGGRVSGAGPVTVTGTYGSTAGGVSEAPIILPVGASFVMSPNATMPLNESVTCNGTFTMMQLSQLSIATGKVLTLNGASTMNEGAIQSGGTVILSATGSLTTDALAAISQITCPFQNFGTLVNQTGRLTLSSYFQEGGSLTISDTINGNLTINGGEFRGAGTVNGAVSNKAIVRPQGILELTGNYQQTATGTLAIDVRGTTPGTGFDQLSVVQSATLAGTLSLSVSGGFAPTGSQTFAAVTFANRTGTFTTVDANGSGLSPVYSNTAVTLFPSGPSPVIAGFVAPSPIRSGRQVAFSVTATDSDTTALSATFDFGDGTPAATVAFNAGETASTTHTYSTTTGTAFNGTITVTDGFSNVTQAFTTVVLLPAPGAENVPNISQGKTVANPLAGLTLQMTDSAGGIIELTASATALIPSSCVTNFGVGGTDVIGPTPVNKFTAPTIAIATTTATVGSAPAKARKTVLVSSRELNAPVSGIVDNRTTQSIGVKTIKGKFVFKDNGQPGAKRDQVSFSGAINLPAGVDLSKSQDISVAIGNVVDTVTVSPKGKGAPGSAGRVTKLKVKFPKLPKGTTVTVGNEKAQVDFTITLPDLDLAGFDTEGVARGAKDLDAKRMAPRTIQLGVLLAGVSYEFLAPVIFKTDKKDETGQILIGRGTTTL